jgi:hypothetical protein
MVARIKERLSSVFSSGLFFLIQLVLLGMIYVPLQYLGFPWWVDVLIALSTFIFQVLGGIVYIVVWIWSFIIMVQSPFAAYSIVYLVFLVLYIFLSFILPHLFKNRGSR